MTTLVMTVHIFQSLPILRHKQLYLAVQNAFHTMHEDAIFNVNLTASITNQ